MVTKDNDILLMLCTPYMLLHALVNAPLMCTYVPLTNFGVTPEVNLQEHTGWERLIRSHSSARFCFELSGNSN